MVPESAQRFVCSAASCSSIFRSSCSGSGSPGASDGDWMLFLGSAGLAGLFVGLPIFTGVTMETWTLWASFGVVLVLSALLGRGGKNVKEA